MAPSKLASPEGVAVEILHAFGSYCGTTLRDPVLFADVSAQHLVHPVGRHVAFRHVDSGSATYVTESPQVQSVTACAISRSRSALAICEKCNSEPVAQITVYNLRVVGGQPTRQPERTLQDIGVAGVVTCVGFSADEEATLLIFASAPPQAMVMVVDWRNNVVVGRCALSSGVERVALSPAEDGVLSASGTDSLHLWAIPEKATVDDEPAVGEARSDVEVEAVEAPSVLHSHESQVEAEERHEERRDSLELEALAMPAGLSDVPATNTDHAWIVPADGTLVVCTQECHAHILLAVRRLPPRLLRTIAAPFQGAGEVPRCVRCFAGGFLFGGGAATLALWERPSVWSLQVASASTAPITPEAAAAAFVHVKTASVVPNASSANAICCIDVAGAGEDGESKEDRLALGFTNRSIGTMSLADLRRSFSDNFCELLCGGFHPGPVSCLAMAVLRPIIASVCKKECAVRVWNHVTRRCELRWEFPNEEPLSVALHPMGYFLAVAFADRVRLMQVLVAELKPHREIPLRGCRSLRFSNGGHLLAVAQGKLVLIFSSRTLAKVATLRGHSQLVVGMSFDPEDRALTTCDEGGGLFEWGTQQWWKAGEASGDRSLGTEAMAVTSGSGGHACVSLLEASRTLLRSYRHCAVQPDDELELTGAQRLGALCYHDGPLGVTILGAAASGALWCCSGLRAVVEMQEVGLHTGACLDVCLSADARIVATAGEDGAIFVLRVRGLAPAADFGLVPTAGRGPGVENEVVMVNRGEIQLREEEIQQLAGEVASLKARLVEDSARSITDCVARVAEARKQDQEEIETLRQKCEALQQASTAQEREALRRIKSTEAAHVQAADRLEAAYDKKIRREADRFMAVETELRHLAEKLEALREESQQKVETQRLRRRQELLRRVGEKDTEIQKLKDLIAFTQHRFDTMLDQEAMENDVESSELLRKNQNDLEQQRLVEYRLKKDQDTVLRSLDMMEKERERAAKEAVETSIIVRDLTAEVDRLQREVAALKSERRDREATLRDKELEIGAYKLKVNTLKKFKHVLDFRLREVTLSLQPKDDTIAQLGGELRDLEEEFERQLDVHKQMEANLQSFDEQIKEKLAECNRLRESIKQRDQVIFKFTEDLRELATNEQDIRKWPEGIRRIHRIHVKPERLPKHVGDYALEELSRQIAVTERKASSLAARGKTTEEESQADLCKRVEENSALIRELDQLRKEKKELTVTMKALELKVKNIEHRLNQREQSVASGGAGSPAALPPATASPPSPPSDDAEPNLFPAFPGSQVAGYFGQKALSQSICSQSSQDTSVGKLRKAGVSHRAPEERRHMQRLLAAADHRAEQVQMQRLEQKLLQDQLDRLQQERVRIADPEVSSPTELHKAAPAAGAGLAAARAAASSPSPAASR